MKKKFLCTLFAVLMFTTSAYAQDIKININGNYIKTDAVCETKDNKMFVPISFIAGGLGGEIKWENSKAVITLGDSSIVFEPGSKTAYKNNTAVALQDEVYISNDRTFVPLDSIKDALGCSVNYDSETGVISINSELSGENKDLSAPPKIILENHNSNFVTVPVNWNGKTDNTDIYTAVLDSDDADTNIYRPQVNELFRFSFENSVPDKVSVSMTYYGNRDNKWEEQSVPVFKNGKTFEFVNQPIPSLASFWGSRIYIIEAAWGENICRYAFITDNKFIYSAWEDLGQRMEDLHAIDYCIIDNYVYYAVLGDEEGFHRMLLDGTEDKRICDFSAITTGINGSTRIKLSEADDNSLLCEIQPMRQYNEDGSLTPLIPADYYKINLSDYTVTRLDTVN